MDLFEMIPAVKYELCAVLGRVRNVQTDVLYWKHLFILAYDATHAWRNIIHVVQVLRLEVLQGEKAVK